MQKRKFKVVMNKENSESYLVEKEGYFINMFDIKIFVYKSIDRLWRATDIETGAFFIQGHTFREVKENIYLKFDKYLKFRETEEYKKMRFKYQKLLRNEELK